MKVFIVRNELIQSEPNRAVAIDEDTAKCRAVDLIVDQFRAFQTCSLQSAVDEYVVERWSLDGSKPETIVHLSERYVLECLPELEPEVERRRLARTRRLEEGERRYRAHKQEEYAGLCRAAQTQKRTT